MGRISLFIVFFWMIGVCASELHLTFQGFSGNKGDLKYLVFPSEKGHPDEIDKSIASGTIGILSAKDGIVLSLPKGRYAVTAIHDENQNGKLDTNFLGIPKEGFGFSRNPSVFFGPPSFEETAFDLVNEKSITIKMKHIWRNE